MRAGQRDQVALFLARRASDTAGNGVRPELQKIPLRGIDEAWSRVVEKKARYRFVIDIGTP